MHPLCALDNRIVTINPIPTLKHQGSWHWPLQYPKHQGTLTQTLLNYTSGCCIYNIYVDAVWHSASGCSMDNYLGARWHIWCCFGLSGTVHGYCQLTSYNTLQETLVNTSEALYQTQQLCEQERTYFCKKLFNVTLIVKWMFLCYHTLFSVLRPYERLGLQVSTRPFFTPSLFSLYECAYHIRTLVCVLSFKGKEGRVKCVLFRCLLYVVVRTCLHPGNHCKSLTTTIYCGVYLRQHSRVTCIVNHVTCKPYILDVTQLFQFPYTYARSAQLSMHVFWKWRHPWR